MTSTRNSTNLIATDSVVVSTVEVDVRERRFHSMQNTVLRKEKGKIHFIVCPSEIQRERRKTWILCFPHDHIGCSLVVSSHFTLLCFDLLLTPTLCGNKVGNSDVTK